MFERIQTCVVEGCYNPAVGVSRWDPRTKPETRYCRADYLTEAMGATVLAEVIGPCPVTDVRTQDGVGFGGTVELDPLQVNIAQLVYAGHIRVLPPPKAKTKPGTQAQDG